MTLFLVTGASGFVGRAVVGELVRRGHQVRAHSRRHSMTSLASSAEIVLGDLRNPASSTSATQGVHTIVHIAGQTGGRGATRQSLWSHNVLGTRLLAAAAVAADVQAFVHVSTASVYGPPSRDGVRDEDFHPASTSAYATSKLAGEAAIRETVRDSMTWTILRPSLVFGPGSTAFRALLERIRRRPYVLTTPGDERINPVYVEDLSRVIATVSESPTPLGTLNVGGPRSVLLEEYRNLLARTAGIQRHRWPLPQTLSMPLARIVAMKHMTDPEARRVLLQKAAGRILEATISNGRLLAHYEVTFTPLQLAVRATIEAIAQA